MGFSGISIWNLLIILVIVVLLFGTKRLKSLGTDLGGMLKGFKDSMNDANKTDDKTEAAPADVKSVEQTTTTPNEHVAANEKSSTQQK